MPRLPTLLMLLAAPLSAFGQDSHQIARLEQDVRQLQREVQILSQLVNQLRVQAGRAQSPATTAPPPLGGSRAAPPPSPVASDARWLNAARWRNLRTGMSELEVIAELGPPTSIRGEDPERVLLYALEIASSGFLAGSVTLRDRAVVAIEMPILK